MTKPANNKSGVGISTPITPGAAVERVSSEELEAALASMSRTEEQTKERMRAYFLQGMSLPDIAARDGIRVEGVANAARRVRARILALASSSPTHRNSRHEAVIVRVRPEDLERVMASMPRIEEQTKERMRAYFLQGMSLPDIAARDGVRVEGVANAVRRVRDVLQEHASPWQYMEIAVTLPMVLAQELQGLSGELARMPRRSDADAALKPVLDAVAKARKQINHSRK